MRGLIAVCCFVSMMGEASLAAADLTAKRTYHLPADDVANALKLFSEQSGRGVIAGTDLVKGIRTNRVRGELTAVEALKRMLAGTGLVAVEDPKSGTFAIRKETDAEKNGAAVTVKTASDRPPPSEATSATKPSPTEHAMISSQRPPAMKRVLSALAALFFAAAPTAAQSEAAGSIEGRVQNSTTGDYLNNARVIVEGTNLTTLTNEFGEYRIAGIAPGERRVTAFYSGLPSQTTNVSVTAGQRTMKDFELQSATVDETVRLDAVTVTAGRLAQAEIATNEQRFAPNMKSVLAADEFGEQLENNVGEFLKLMPAISVEYVDTDVRNASIRGMPAHTTIVTANGNQLASAASTSASRVFEFEQISINEIARVEVNKSLVPDMPAEGIGGTINLITKSAFERARPDLKFRVYLNANTLGLDVERTPGPNHRPTHKIKPGFDFTYIRPINKNLGFTISGASSQKTQLGSRLPGSGRMPLTSMTGRSAVAATHAARMYFRGRPARRRVFRTVRPARKSRSRPERSRQGRTARPTSRAAGGWCACRAITCRRRLRLRWDATGHLAWPLFRDERAAYRALSRRCALPRDGVYHRFLERLRLQLEHQ